MGSRTALLSLCILFVYTVCADRFSSDLLTIDDSPPVASAISFYGQDGILAKIEGFFDGKHSFDFAAFGRKLHIRLPRIPSNWGEVTATIRRFMNQLRKDPFTRTFTVIYANIILLVLVYMILFVVNIHLALKHRRAIAAASDGKSLLKRARSTKIDMSGIASRTHIFSSTARTNTRKSRSSITNLDSGLLLAPGKSELKGKLSFNESGEAEIPRLVDHSMSDAFDTFSSASTPRNVHLSRNGIINRDEQHIAVEVHKEDGEGGTSLTVGKPVGTSPHYGTTSTPEQYNAVDVSAEKYTEIKSPKYESVHTHPAEPKI